MTITTFECAEQFVPSVDGDRQNSFNYQTIKKVVGVVLWFVIVSLPISPHDSGINGNEHLSLVGDPMVKQC